VKTKAKSQFPIYEVVQKPSVPWVWLLYERWHNGKPTMVKGELYGWPDGAVPQRIAELLTKYGVES